MLGTTRGFRLEGSPSTTTTGSPWDPGAGDTPVPGCDKGGNTGTRGHGPLFAVLPSPASPRRLAPVFTPSLLQPRFLKLLPAVLSRPRRAHGPRWHRDGDSGVLGGSDSAPRLTLAPSRISKDLQVSVSQPSAPRARSRIRRPVTPGVPAVLGMSQHQGPLPGTSTVDGGRCRMRPPSRAVWHAGTRCAETQPYCRNGHLARPINHPVPPRGSRSVHFSAPGAPQGLGAARPGLRAAHLKGKKGEGSGWRVAATCGRLRAGGHRESGARGHAAMHPRAVGEHGPATFRKIRTLVWAAAAQIGVNN